MIGYIYYIKNIVNNKMYIGLTININKRKTKHLNALRKGEHHSTKLQRAFNKYGEDNFEWIIETYLIDSIEDLYFLEIKYINEYDTYNNGYNETLGGEGHRLLFNFEDCCIIYKITNTYSGINRKLSNYFNCDHDTINQISKNQIFNVQNINEDKYNGLIKDLELTDSMLKENYKPHNEKKLDELKCHELLSIITTESGYDRLLADLFNVDTKLLYRLKNNLIYKDYIKTFNEKSQEERNLIKDDVLLKYDLEHLRLVRKRANVKNSLTQELINYILENKDSLKKTEIAKNLNISYDRVNSVIAGKSYKDLVVNYYNSIK